jgi:hypothetical protein
MRYKDNRYMHNFGKVETNLNLIVPCQRSLISMGRNLPSSFGPFSCGLCLRRCYVIFFFEFYFLEKHPASLIWGFICRLCWRPISNPHKTVDSASPPRQPHHPPCHSTCPWRCLSHLRSFEDWFFKVKYSFFHQFQLATCHSTRLSSVPASLRHQSLPHLTHAPDFFVYGVTFIHRQKLLFYGVFFFFFFFSHSFFRVVLCCLQLNSNCLGFKLFIFVGDPVSAVFYLVCPVFLVYRVLLL